MISSTGAENKVGIESEGIHPVTVSFQCAHQFALKKEIKITQFF